MNKKSVILMLCYARSGGTLLNRCLYSFPNTVIFSEINPEATWLTEKNKISKQAREWYNLTINDNTFIGEITQAINVCAQKDVNLIVRDFSYGSFVPRSYNSYNPSMRLTTLHQLEDSQIALTPFAFVRNAKDVWLSMRDSSKDFHDKNLSGLFKFVCALIENKIKIFKYEDFCQDPKKVMKDICAYTNLKYTDRFLTNFAKIRNVTGDINQIGASRGFRQNKIMALNRRKINAGEMAELKNQTMAEQINSMLAYQG